MVVPVYPLARPPAGTEVHSLPVERINQAILFSHLRTGELIDPDGILIPVHLIPDLVHGGWRVRWSYGVIGSLPAGMRGHFTDIERIHDAHVEPSAFARVRIDRDRGLLDVAVELPAPDLSVARNGLPPGGMVLPQGRRIPAALDGPDGQLLGLLDGADVLVDGQVIATLDPATAHRVSVHQGADAPIGVRVFIVDGEAFVDVEAGDPVQVPAIPEPAVEETHPDPAPGTALVTPPTAEGVWALTMAADDLTEPAPTGPRTITFAAVEVPDD